MMTVKNTNNIEKVIDLATPEEIKNGKAWYANAQADAKQASIDTGIPLSTMVGVFAALSPSHHWERNRIAAPYMVHGFINGDNREEIYSHISTYPKMKDKAWSIIKDMLETDEDILTRLNGQKIKSFYECIMGYDACCIDGHALNIWRYERVGLTTNKTGISKKLYAEIQGDYVRVAKKLGMKAYELQAITWVAWRRIHGIT